jgi:plastocyanin
MKSLNRLFIFSALLVSAVSSAQAVETNQVIMKSLSYVPKQIKIVQGQSVTWKNTSYTEHSATSEGNPSAFDTGMIASGKESKPVRFEKVGEYAYHCSMHGKTMSGVVIVTASPAVKAKQE